LSSKTDGFRNGRGMNGNGSSFNGSFLISDRQEEISRQDILKKIYRRRNLVLMVFLLVLTLAALYTFHWRPTYEATLQVLIQKGKIGSSNISGGMGDVLEPFKSDERGITDEMNFLQTNLLRTDVAKELLDSSVIMVKGEA